MTHSAAVLRRNDKTDKLGTTNWVAKVKECFSVTVIALFG